MTTSDAYVQLCSNYHSRHASFGDKAGPILIVVRQDVSSICAARCLLCLLQCEDIEANIFPEFTTTRHKSFLECMGALFEHGEPGKTQADWEVRISLEI